MDGYSSAVDVLEALRGPGIVQHSRLIKTVAQHLKMHAIWRFWQFSSRSATDSAARLPQCLQVILLRVRDVAQIRRERTIHDRNGKGTTFSRADTGNQ